MAHKLSAIDESGVDRVAVLDRQSDLLGTGESGVIDHEFELADIGVVARIEHEFDCLLALVGGNE